MTVINYCSVLNVGNGVQPTELTKVYMSMQNTTNTKLMLSVMVSFSGAVALLYKHDLTKQNCRA